MKQNPSAPLPHFSPLNMMTTMARTGNRTLHNRPNGQAGQGSVSAPGPKPQAEFSHEAPAEAPSNSLSKVDEATVPKRNQKRNGKQKRNSNTQDQPTFEDLFGINSDSWTRFFVLNGTGDLDNLDIYEDLNKKLNDDFNCIRRRDAKTRRNAVEVEKLQKIQNKDVNTARDLRLISIRGTMGDLGSRATRWQWHSLC